MPFTVFLFPLLLLPFLPMLSFSVAVITVAVFTANRRPSYRCANQSINQSKHICRYNAICRSRTRGGSRV